MARSRLRPSFILAGIAVLAVAYLLMQVAPDRADPAAAAGPDSHADLVALFDEWRAFERPEFADGVPDYSAAAMARQQQELPGWQARLGSGAPEAGPCRSRSTGTWSAPR